MVLKMNEIGGKLRALIDDQFLYEIPNPQHKYIKPCLTFYKKLYNTKCKISHLFNLEYGHIIKYNSREIGWAIRHKLENNLIQWKELSKIHNHHSLETHFLKSILKNKQTYKVWKFLNAEICGDDVEPETQISLS